jgi:hypothetical protein
VWQIVKYPEINCHLFFDGRPTGPALLKKQNVDWGYQFYRAATHSFTSQKNKNAQEKTRLERLTPSPSTTPLASTDSSQRENYYKVPAF